MKPFRTQFKECLRNGIAELMDLNHTEKMEVRPNSKGIENIKIEQVYFCKKYLKRCSSKVCLKDRIK